jgi:hypothetical protein
VPDLNAYQPDAEHDPLLVYADVTDARWPVSIAWGDGATDQIPADDEDNIEHRYRQGGTFNVTATDDQGQTATGTVSIPFADARAGGTPFAAGDKGDPDAVVLGPGLLYVGDASAADPADATTPPSATAFRPVGYTEEGSSFAYETTSEDITVAEENDPIRTVPTGTSSTLSFSMAEMTWQNLLLALNAGSSAGTVPPTMPTEPIEPVEPGSEVRVKLIWDSDYGSRWIFRQCVQSGTLTIDRKKAPDKGLLPVEFKCEKPSTGAPFAVIPSADGLV